MEFPVNHGIDQQRMLFSLLVRVMNTKNPPVTQPGGGDVLLRKEENMLFLTPSNLGLQDKMET